MELLIILIIIGGVFIFFIQNKNLESYYKLPKLEEYIQQNPKCATENGIKCVNCGSRSIKNWGLYKSNSKERLHICNHCNSTLYKS
jgi:hypothetical protein